MEKSSTNSDPSIERRSEPHTVEQQKRFANYEGMQEALLQKLERQQITREEFKRRNAGSMMLLENMAFTSYKTLLPNELFFKNTLEAEIGIMNRIKEHTGYVAYIDVDDLKGANGAYGHAGGDELLGIVAQALIAASDEIHQKYQGHGVGRIFPAHVSGDEFTALIGGLSREKTEELGKLVLEKVLKGKALSERLRSLPSGKAASIGFRAIDGNSETDTSIEEADLAMMEAKDRGRNQMVFFEDMDQTAIAKRRLEKTVSTSNGHI